MNAVACGSCGAIVEAGRLSCAACGSLLAMVTRTSPFEAAEPQFVSEPRTAEPCAPNEAPPAEASQDPSTHLLVDDEPPSTGAQPAVAPASQVPASRVPGSYVARWSVPTPRFARAVPLAPSVPSIATDQMTSAPSLAPASTSLGAMAATGPARPLAVATGSAAPAVTAPALTAAGVPALPAAGSPSVLAAGSPSGRAGRAGLLADLPLDAPDDIPSWLVLIGSVVALASFPLPWASQGGMVLGTQGGAGYFDRWGLASLSDVGLFIATLALLALAIVPNRLPLRFRFGYLPIVLGGIDLGVGWVYLGLTFGYGTGVVVLLFGAILLIAGSSLALRHPGPPSGVQ